MNELQKLHATIWRFREVMEPFWATPEPVDCLRYAFCEAGEAMDAWLRQQRPNDSRNNERQPDVLDELADCAIMLLSAVPIDKFTIPSNSGVDGLTLGSICYGTARAMHFPDRGLTLNVANLIAHYSGMNLKERIVGRLWKIAHKHAPPDVFQRAVDIIYE